MGGRYGEWRWCWLLVWKASFAKDMRREGKRSVQFVQGTADAIMSVDTHHSGLLRNRLDDVSWFVEAAGTALMTAAVLHMATLVPDYFGEKYIKWEVRRWRSSRHVRIVKWVSWRWRYQIRGGFSRERERAVGCN